MKAKLYKRKYNVINQVVNYFILSLIALIKIIMTSLFGSGALSGKMLPVKIVENNVKLMIF